jgi:hypothetical protein
MLKPSRFYQRWLQLVSRGSDILLFLMGYCLGKEVFWAALVFLVAKIVVGFTVSELMYKRMRAVVREEK